MQKTIGFSLFELMIALIIIGILSVIAFPLYAQYIVHERRVEAEMTLTKMAAAFEEYYIMHNTYKKATLDALGFPEKIAANRYQLKIASATDSHFVIEAIPLEIQAKKDLVCGKLTLDAAGKKGTAGTGSTEDCW